MTTRGTINMTIANSSLGSLMGDMMKMRTCTVKIHNYLITSSEKLNMWLNIYHITVYNSIYCIF